MKTSLLAVVTGVLTVTSAAAQTFLNIQINSDTSGNLHNEEQVVANPLDSSNVVAVWRDFRLGYRRVGAGYSFDGGLTWHDTLLEDDHFPRHSDPGLTVDAAGNFHATILSYTGNTSEPNGLYVQTSTDGGMTWGPSIAVVESVPGVFEDKQLIACDRADSSPYIGNLYCVWARFYATQIMFNRSTDGNRSWGTPLAISDGPASRQWPVPAVGPNGEVYCAWCHLSSPRSIRFDRSTDGGLTWDDDITVQDVQFGSGYIQPSVSVFSFPAMDVDITQGPRRGWLYIAYMDRAQSGNGTNIFFTRSTDKGTTWSPRVKINDDPDNGKDHFHPWLCVDRKGDITAAWYDRRLDPGNMLMDIYMAQSFNGGDSWTDNVRVSNVSSDPRLFPPFDRTGPGGRPRPLAGRLGEYNGLWAVSRDRVYAVWADTRNGHPDIFIGTRDTSTAVAELPKPQVPAASATPNPLLRHVEFHGCGPGTPVRVFDRNGLLVATVATTRIWDAGRLPAGVYLAVPAQGAAPLKLVKTH
ncbi:MAG: exo-alpha-sialidase [candidate division WOR-3 bacterium]|nr:MAG: exo-alpha-sialidase [candidate division WOR-3 bacterium]